MKPTEALRPWIPQRPPPDMPHRKWVSELEDMPLVAPDLSERLAELREIVRSAPQGVTPQ